MFGGEHLESDEEILETERKMKQKLYEAFGSDSDDDKPAFDAVMELAYSDIEEEGETITLPIGRVQITNVEINPVQQAKALAQIKRQE